MFRRVRMLMWMWTFVNSDERMRYAILFIVNAAFWRFCLRFFLFDRNKITFFAFYLQIFQFNLGLSVGVCSVLNPMKNEFVFSLHVSLLLLLCIDCRIQIIAIWTFATGCSHESYLFFIHFRCCCCCLFT